MRGFLLGGTWLRPESWLCWSPAPAPPAPAPAPAAVPLVWLLLCCCGCGCCGAACACCWGAACCWCWFCCCWFWGKKPHNTVTCCELGLWASWSCQPPVTEGKAGPCVMEHTARLSAGRSSPPEQTCIPVGYPSVIILLFLMKQAGLKLERQLSASYSYTGVLGSKMWVGLYILLSSARGGTVTFC